ncbi:MarR family winged helix-turn-helix transcriptional regulator [Peribacillus frigoritolerans]|uniref:MarR family winged helix-turn-helix transcriptional regulator n=1 Tax=Peribacillus frigoritolerans TaxID=450367 RepID=UPI0010597F86|nr:MarR family transcriptional regulator [Peribacillus frigoritolerans]TDL79309.1 MarR family transcriptional regulator [Peribacillus frigoritolerans]
MKTYQKFFQQLLLLYRPFENRLNIELAKHDLYRAQWSVLHYLSNYGTATLVELADYQSVEKPTVTRTISRLEELGYVEHVPGKDKREKRMQLTDTGRKVYGDVRVTIDEYEQEILKGISEEEQLEVIRIMGDIRNNIRE